MLPLYRKNLLAVTLVSLAAPSASFAQENPEIVITASRVEMPREASGSAITVLDAEYLENNQIRLVSDALRDVPGLAVNRAGGVGGKTDIRIRGAESNQTLVLIDGMEMNEVGESSFNFANLLNLEIEKIEVLRGAQSALWGSDAMGGVINIITKKGQGPLQYKISAEAGSFGTHQESFSLSSGNEQYNFALSGAFFDTDGISVFNEDRGFKEDDGYENQSFNFIGGVQVTDNFQLNLALHDVNSEAESDSEKYLIGPVDDASAVESGQTLAKLSGQLSLFEGKWNHKLGISEGNTRYQSIIPGLSPYEFSGEKEKLEYQTDYHFGSKGFAQNFIFAAEYERENYINQASNYDFKTDSKGLVLEYNVNINDQYYVTLAGRRDINSQFKNKNTYRMALAGWLTDNVRTHISAGSGIKNPTMFELYGSTPGYTGNANLTPEENKTWDLGAEYHFSALDGYIDLTLFNSDVENFIEKSGSSSLNSDSKVNIKGLELSATVQPTEQLSINASYTYTDSDDGKGDALTRRAKHIASINASHLLSNGRTRLTGGLKYNGKQYDTKLSPTFVNLGRVILEDYTLANIALSHDYSDKVRVYGRIDNLFDDHYEEVLNYGTLGRAFTLGIEVKGGF